MTITLLQGDCRAVLATLPERSVQTCVTSPPYFGLRNYSVDGPQIGMESTPAEYVAALVEVFRAVRRVLRDDGTCWINLGDSYSGSWGNYAPGGIKNQQRPQTEEGKRWERRAYGDTTTLPATARVPGLAEKNLIGIPWRVAFALQDDGWVLRSDIIWSKPNCMPESVTDRPTRSHEYLFLFAKQARYFYDADAIREGFTAEPKRRGQRAPGDANRDPDKRTDWPAGQLEIRNDAGRNKRSVWTIGTRPFSGAHFAVFPEQLIEPCILAGSAAQACEVCGAPWARVVERESIPVRPNFDGMRGLLPKSQERERQGGDKVDRAGNTATLTRGFRPTCAHDNAGAGRCVVLDPFVGSGTTCRVAERFGRDSIGIDLGYQDLQERRTDGVQIEMEAYL